MSRRQEEARKWFVLPYDVIPLTIMVGRPDKIRCVNVLVVYIYDSLLGPGVIFFNAQS